ncbi:hypothetical protein MIMGU_mgv1a014576mg [Erythranthe guttata]|uniref:Phytocyanin domain-containing protein n=1 Tax=Erythranthe guttata TaxID=4155 RepID=A0A022S2V7_ERYGU|nr:PREDICTED: mavicyanin-like [Erythranthe guttata]EYU46581.1 hypothetical protein MIMGU_mgv1a014576mg [Erythranthe guttata]|eukprot:XP_012837247.1 PREDICTED: mavicyanin-like [Erythranthe guttata]
MGGVLLWLLLIMISISGFCKGAVYKVGDYAGWTIVDNMDYNKWASSKTFRVGDTLIFEYDNLFHNVLEVTRSEFHSCDAESPIATYDSGNDSVVIRSPGHYYYICGLEGHCQAGQKVDIRVPKSNEPAKGPIQSPIQVTGGATAPKGSPIGTMAPGPSHSGGESLNNWLLSYNLGVLLSLVLIFY